MGGGQSELLSDAPFGVGIKVRVYRTLPPGEDFDIADVVGNDSNSRQSHVRFESGAVRWLSWKRLGGLQPGDA